RHLAARPARPLAEDDRAGVQPPGPGPLSPAAGNAAGAAGPGPPRPERLRPEPAISRPSRAAARLAQPAKRGRSSHRAAGAEPDLPSLSRSRDMIRSQLGKLLRDLRVPLIVVMVLLCAFQCLWAKITQRIIKELLPEITRVMLLGD